MTMKKYLLFFILCVLSLSVNATSSGSVARNTGVNQACITLQDGSVYYYNTSAIQKVNINNDNTIVTIAYQNSDGTTVNDELKNVARIKGLQATAVNEGNGTFANAAGKVEILDARGWRESAYVTWKLFDGATSYRVQVKGENISDYTTIDQQLVRNYGTYGRADVVGLKAGTYSLRVIPVKDGVEETDSANEATALAGESLSASGFRSLQICQRYRRLQQRRYVEGRCSRALCHKRQCQDDNLRGCI